MFLKGRSILNTDQGGGTSSEFAGGTLTLGEAGVIKASEPDISYTLEDPSLGTHAFEGNITVENGYYYIGDGSLLTGIVSMPSDITANSISSNTFYTFSENSNVRLFVGNSVQEDTLEIAGNVYIPSDLVAGSLVVEGSADILGNLGVSSVDLPTGTPGNPTLTFLGSSNTGLFSPNVGQVSVTANGIETFSIASNLVTSNATLKLLQGTVTAPSLLFGSDTSSGFYQSAVGQVAITSNGVQQLLVTSAGLSISSNLYTANGTPANPSYTFANARTSGMFLSNATTGNVGISANGIEVLTVARGLVVANGNVQIAQQGTTATPSLVFGSDFSSGFYQPAVGQVAISTGSLQQVLVTSAGLTVSNVYTGNGTAANPSYTFANAKTSGMYLSNATTGNVSLTTGGTERLQVSSGLVTALGNAYVTGSLVVDGSITSATGEIVLEDLILDSSANNAVLTTSADGVIQSTDARIVGNVVVANAFAAGNAYTFGATDPGTYMYRPVAGQVAILANGSQIVTADQTQLVIRGNVIGNAYVFTNNPSSGLFLGNTVDGNVAITANGTQTLVVSNGMVNITGNLGVSNTLSFAGDLTTGMYAPSTGQVAILANGVQSLIVNSSNVVIAGNVIGNTYTFPTDSTTFVGNPAAGQVAITTGGIQSLLVDSSKLTVAGNVVGNAFVFPTDSTTFVGNPVAGQVAVTANSIQTLVVDPSRVTINGNLVASNLTLANMFVTTLETSGELETGSLVVVGSADVLGNVSAANVSIAQNLVLEGGNVSFTTPTTDSLVVSASNVTTFRGNVTIGTAGTNAAPSLKFGTDTNTGLYAPATGQVAVSIGGVERINVGKVSSNKPTGVDIINSDLHMTLGYGLRWFVDVNNAARVAMVGTNMVLRAGYTNSCISLGGTSGQPNECVTVFQGGWNNNLLVGSHGRGAGWGSPYKFHTEGSMFGTSLTLGQYTGGGVLTASGSAASPPLSFAPDATSGLYAPAAGQVAVSSNTVQTFTVAPGLVTSNANIRILPIGGAAAPSLYFGSDTASGIYAPAVGQVAITAGGVESTRFLDSNVNIYGNLSVTQDITAFASDARLKTNLRPITDRPLMAVHSLRGVRFDWRDDGPQPMRGTEVGLIAQDVSNVLPEAVCPAPFDNTFLTIRMNHQLTALLVEAIKELSDRVGALENNNI